MIYKKNRLLQTTINNSIYKKALKERYAGCSFCPWHDIENASHWRYTKSWKKHRKTKWRRYITQQE